MGSSKKYTISPITFQWQPPSWHLQHSPYLPQLIWHSVIS